MSNKFKNVWDAISDTPEDVENMKLRSVFMIAITERIERTEGTQSDKASDLGLTQPRLNDLLKGRIDKFSLDALVKIATNAGLSIKLDVKAA